MNNRLDFIDLFAGVGGFNFAITQGGVIVFFHQRLMKMLAKLMP